MVKTSQELLQAVLESRQEVSEIDAKLSEAKEIKNAAEIALIEYMENNDLKSFKDATLNCSAITRETLYVSIDKDRRDEAYRWITDDMGRNDLVKPSIHNKTLSSFVGEMLKNGEKVPQELFKYFFKKELTIVTAK